MEEMKGHLRFGGAEAKPGRWEVQGWVWGTRRPSSMSMEALLATGLKIKLTGATAALAGFLSPCSAHTDQGVNKNFSLNFQFKGCCCQVSAGASSAHHLAAGDVVIAVFCVS